MKLFESILVVSRMNPYSGKTIKTGISLARKYSAKLYVLHLVSSRMDFITPDAAGIFPDAQYTGYLNSQQAVRKQLENIIAVETGSGFPIKELVSELDSISEIERVVREENVDLILTNAHREGRLEHALFGGENDAMIRTMPCSILLVKEEPESLNMLSAS
jgi:nucleotide-binding universal stress UspA family protein